MKKSQGEIFGIALFFVVIIVGIIIYANIQALQPDNEQDSFQQKQFEVLSSNAINGIQKMSTSCEIEQNEDSLEDLIRYCFDYARSSDHDPTIECEESGSGSGTQEYNACERSFNLLNQSLQNMFNNSDDAIVASVPFSIELVNPDFEHNQWHNKTITNVEQYGLSLNRSNESYYLEKEYTRDNAGFNVITTGRRDLEINFNVYYR